MAETFGLIAGSGQFPFLVAQGAKKKGYDVIICGFAGNTDPALESEAAAFNMLHLGQFSSLIKFMRDHGVKKLCMAGAINKPKARDIRPDWRAAKILFRLGRHWGDDAILRAVCDELAGEGFEVVRPETMAEGIGRGHSGVLTKTAPDAEGWRDVMLGWEMARAVGRLDIGQCVAVKQSVIVAVEAIEGTDALIARAGQLVGPGCTLVKAAKPDQDNRVDLPALGRETVRLAAEYGFANIAFDGRRALFFDAAESVNLADAKGISVIAVPEDDEVFFKDYRS